MRRQPTLRGRVAARIAERQDDAFLTREFADLGGERQVLRALRTLTGEGKLIRLGYGAYARAVTSPITRQPMLAGDGFGAVSRQLLDKLRVEWEKAGFRFGDGNGGPLGIVGLVLALRRTKSPKIFVRVNLSLTFPSA